MMIASSGGVLRAEVQFIVLAVFAHVYNMKRKLELRCLLHRGGVNVSSHH